MEEVVSGDAGAVECPPFKLLTCAGDELRSVSAALSLEFPNMLRSYSCTHCWKLVDSGGRSENGWPRDDWSSSRSVRSLMLAPAAPIQPFARFKRHHKANGVQWLIAPDRRHYRPYDVKRDCAIYARRGPKNFAGNLECRPKRGTKCPTQGSLSAAVGHNRSKAVGRSGARCVGGGARGRASPSEEKQGVREMWDSQPFHGMIRLSCCVSHRRPGPASTNRTNE